MASNQAKTTNKTSFIFNQLISKMLNTMNNNQGYFIQKLANDKTLKHIRIDGHDEKFTESINIYDSPQIKVPSELHHRFDVIWHDFIPFGNSVNWRYVLDESLRLIGKEGRIVLVFEADGNNKVCTSYQKNMANAKMFLFRKPGIECTIEFENPAIFSTHSKSELLKQHQKIISVIKVTRTNLEIYQDKNWSFAMITSGNKVDHVINFCKSIRAIDPEFQHEIIICGPKNPEYEKFTVKYLETEKYRDDYAEICHKKNDIAHSANNQNLLIAHDRFLLSPDFFSGFEKYGYDFDFICTNSRFEDGSDDHCWIGLRKNVFDENILLTEEFFDASSRFDISGTSDLRNLNLSHSFISGGCMIFKRDILRLLKFNDLIFWHQIEDVEISGHMIKNNILPHINPHSYVINTRKVIGEENFSHKTFVRKIRKSLAKKLFRISKALYVY